MNKLAREDLYARLALWLPRQRWFAGKGHKISAVDAIWHTEIIQNAEFAVDAVLAQVHFSDQQPQLYSIFIGYRPYLPAYLAQQEIGSAGTDQTINISAYDALYDEEFISALPEFFLAQKHCDNIIFHLQPEHSFRPKMTGHVLNQEQSNTSIIWENELIIKFFRRINLGTNPEVEIQKILTDTQCQSIAPLQAWISCTIHGEEATLAAASTYAANAADGWSMALTSIRDLLAEGDLLANEVGSDFASEASRLGAGIAQVHKHLKNHLNTQVEFDLAARINRIHQSFESALVQVPQLAEYRTKIHQLLEEAIQEVNSGSIPAELVQVSRIHGDLHLGQVLRTLNKWLIIDFEGEPAKSISERQQADLALADIASMLRSFDYAALHQILIDNPTDMQQEFRAREWAARNSEAFMRGYSEEIGVDPREAPKMLTALLLEKAIYETIYEIHHRPTWVIIPLHAIARIAGKGKSHLGSSIAHDWGGA